MDPRLDNVAPRLDEWAHWPFYEDDEIAAVSEVLRSGKVNQWTGEHVVGFEREYADFLSRPHAVALMNGTVALELALLVLGVGPGHEVITSPRTFIASASSAVLQGAIPVFADVDRDSGNISAETIARVLSPKSKAIIVVHLAGWPADMGPIMDLAREHDLIVIEDCAQAHGAMKGGEPVGALGDAAAFSFCQDKIITTAGEGGLLALSSEDAWARAWAYKDHGKNYSTVFHKEHGPGFRWLHESFGTNWRMTEAQAVVGRLQLERLDEMVQRRNRNADIYREHFAELPALRVPTVAAGDLHAYYKFYAYVEPSALRAGWDRDRIMQTVASRGVPITSGSCSEIYRERAFTSTGLVPPTSLPVAQELGDTSLMLQVHPNLKPASVQSAAEIVHDVVRSASR